jgi:hypothetical protein
MKVFQTEIPCTSTNYHQKECTTHIKGCRVLTKDVINGTETMSLLTISCTSFQDTHPLSWGWCRLRGVRNCPSPNLIDCQWQPCHVQWQRPFQNADQCATQIFFNNFISTPQDRYTCVDLKDILLHPSQHTIPSTVHESGQSHGRRYKL